MDIKTKNDKSITLEILFDWLIGAGFNGFRFDTAFSLYFYQDSKVFYKGSELPRAIEMHLLGDWWIEPSNEWKKRVEKLGFGIEPDEPIKAYELAKLRWTEGSSIKDITFLDSKISIIFENDVVLSISLQCEDEYAFMVKEVGVYEEDVEWLVTCENGNFFYRAKEED
jgi:hypothetical protein